MITASCPECENDIFFDETPEIGQVLICVNCESVLEVTWLFPICLDIQEKKARYSPAPTSVAPAPTQSPTITPTPTEAATETPTPTETSGES